MRRRHRTPGDGRTPRGRASGTTDERELAIVPQPDPDIDSNGQRWFIGLATAGVTVLLGMVFLGPGRGLALQERAIAISAALAVGALGAWLRGDHWR